MSEDFTEAELTAMLPETYRLKRDSKAAANLYENACKPYRDWLDAHPGDFIQDGELGLYAKYQDSEGRELDAIHLAERQPELVIWLALRGCLKLDTKAWDGQLGKSGEAAIIKDGYIIPKGTRRLIIDKEKG